jgi:NADPH2:quinone reductase
MDNNLAIVRELMDELLEWYAEGAMQSHVSHHFELDEVPEAMDVLLSRRSTGEVVINVRT